MARCVEIFVVKSDNKHEGKRLRKKDIVLGKYKFLKRVKQDEAVKPGDKWKDHGNPDWTADLVTAHYLANYTHEELQNHLEIMKSHKILDGETCVGRKFDSEGNEVEKGLPWSYLEGRIQEDV
jgi:hypothetical protein